MKTILLLLVTVSCLFSQPAITVISGADVLFESRTDLINGKRIGLITNHSAVLANGQHLADALASYKNAKLVALFGPEHGIRGDAPDGRTVHDSIDSLTGVPVYSLYGKINTPTPDMLRDVDVLVYDIQDVGARFYTFISTMFLCMDAAAERNIPFIVLDRPNPVRGVTVEGPIRLDSLKTFVGWVPIPIAHGMTVGELATMALKAGWLKNATALSLTVVPMKHWKRTMWFDETNLRWINPSPNMRTLSTAVVYPGLCLIEGTNVSEGRGTEKPFEYIGAPWINGEALSRLLNSLQLPGVLFEPIQFTPREIPNVAARPKYGDKLCHGVFVKVTNRNTFQPVTAGIAVLWGIHSLHKDSLELKQRGLDRLAGTPVVREGILSGKNVKAIVQTWEGELQEFTAARTASLLYQEK